MIVVKTRLQKIPDSCHRCPYYHAHALEAWNKEKFSVCSAVHGYGIGKVVEGIKTTKERAEWCPMKEQEAQHDN